MKVSEYLVAAMCWCNRVEVEIPVGWIADGLTDTCDTPGCGPGCEMVPDSDDPYDEPEYTKRVWKMNKYSPARYDPRDDSTPGLPRKEDYISLLVGDGMCACGCGSAPNGKTARFCMGHDARLKGMLTRAHSAGVGVALVEETTGAITTLEALEYADQFSSEKVDWRKLVSDATAKIKERRGDIDKRASEREVLRRATENGAVRVGRWEKTDSVAAIYVVPGSGEYEVEYVDENGRIRSQKVAVA